MKVSIITVSHNACRTIEDTIRSVLSQDYPDIEYIIVDGKSTDGTLAVIEKHNDAISRLISESDDGIYDAMNKGISMASGDIVGFLNADDIYHDNGVISTVVENMKKHQVDCVWGDLVYVSKWDTGKVIRYWRSSDDRALMQDRGWMPPHPTFFVKKLMYEEFGVFDVNFKFAADYELMLRFLEKYGVRGAYIPRVLVKMRTGGISNRRLRNIVMGNLECYNAWKVNDLTVSRLLMSLKPITKMGQYRF